MAIDFALDPQLVARALQLSGERTQSAAVTKAAAVWDDPDDAIYDRL